MKPHGRLSARLASIGLGIVLLSLAGFATAAAISMSRAEEGARQSGALAQAYEDARSAVASEDFWATEYLLRLGPEAEHLDPAELRREHRNAAVSLVAALRTASRIGGSQDRALVRDVLDEHETYLRAIDSLFAAVDSGSAERALRIEIEEIDVLFPLLEERVDSASTSHRTDAEDSLESAAATGRVMLIATPVAFVLGLVLLGFFWRVIRRYALRADEARDAQLKRLEREALAVAAQNERLHEIDRMKDDFIAAVSHELRTPLTSILGYIDLVLEGETGNLTGEQESFLAIVDRNAERLLRLVGDLLFVAQLETGEFALDLGEVDLPAVAAEALEAARPSARDKGLELEFDAEVIPTLRGDRARLGQLLDNLVSNAIKFTPAGGSVAVRVGARNGDAVLEVSDTGIGISAEDQGMLFQRFFRTTAATEQAIQGAGLGLAITKAIVERHGGTIGAESEEGAGTTFRVELPLLREGMREPQAA